MLPREVKYTLMEYTRECDKNKHAIKQEFVGRDGRTICGPQCVPKSTSVTLAVDEKTLPMATLTGRTDDRQTDRQTDRRTDRVRCNMRPPPREEGRIKSARRRCEHCAMAVVRRSQKKIVPPQTPFPGARDGQNLISWRWSYLYLQTQFQSINQNAFI